ncbi:MAG: hypothetical protein ACJA0Q_002197 [Saprospiraceae bacterium]|jgi:hypothetical protein
MSKDILTSIAICVFFALSAQENNHDNFREEMIKSGEKHHRH